MGWFVLISLRQNGNETSLGYWMSVPWWQWRILFVIEQHLYSSRLTLTDFNRRQVEITSSLTFLFQVWIISPSLTRSYLAFVFFCSFVPQTCFCGFISDENTSLCRRIAWPNSLPLLRWICHVTPILQGNAMPIATILYNYLFTWFE